MTTLSAAPALVDAASPVGPDDASAPPAEGRPTGALRRQIQATEYRGRAADASALAAASPLDHVREKHEMAAARWRALAELNESDDAPTPVGATAPGLYRR